MRSVLLIITINIFNFSYSQSNFDFSKDTFEYNKTYQIQKDVLYSFEGYIDIDKNYSNKLLFNNNNYLSGYSFYNYLDNHIVLIQVKNKMSYCFLWYDFLKIPINKNLQISTSQIENIGFNKFQSSPFFNTGNILNNHENLEIGYQSDKIADNIYKHYDARDNFFEGCNSLKKLEITSKKNKNIFTDNGMSYFSFTDSIVNAVLKDDSNYINEIAKISNSNTLFLKSNNNKNLFFEIYNSSDQLISTKTILRKINNADTVYNIFHLSVKNDSIIIAYAMYPEDTNNSFIKMFNLNGIEIYSTRNNLNSNQTFSKFNELNNVTTVVPSGIYNIDSTKEIYYWNRKGKPTKEFYVDRNDESTTSVAQLYDGILLLNISQNLKNKTFVFLDSSGNVKKKIPLEAISPTGKQFTTKIKSIVPKAFVDSSQNIYIIAPDNSSVNGISYLWITTLTENSFFIEGKILIDLNKNCMNDDTEIGVSNWLIELKQNNISKYTFSDSSGYYSFQTDSGAYQIILHNRNRLVDSVCQLVYTGIINYEQIEPVKINFLIKPTICNTPPRLNIEVFNTPLSKCRNSIYTVNIKNEGYGFEAHPYVDIQIDSFLIFQNSSQINYSVLSNNLYRFNLDTLFGNQSYSFTFNVLVDCNALTGQTHCVDAKVYPKLICSNNTASYLTASANCLGDSVVFEIKNNTNISTVANKKYLLLENDSIILQNNYQLNANQTKKIGIKNRNASTYRLITYQDPNTPREIADSILTTVIEGCTTANNYIVGFVTNIAASDNIADEDINCQQNVASFDPNDKLASPVGFSNEHFIEKNQPITYTLRFQNTGNYYAFDVILTDSISSDFDINTLKYISASHSYNASVINNILKVTFSNILLPWKSFNEQKSNGYFSFQISPKATTTDGTKIFNSAKIYFDFNDAVETNTTFHTIGTNFIKIKVVSTILNNQSKIKTSIYPNPFVESTTISFDYEHATELRILSIVGKTVQQYQSVNNFYTIHKNELTNGLYLYELRNANSKEILDSGKIVIE